MKTVVSDQGSVVSVDRSPLGREWDQGTDGQLRMVNPALACYDQAAPAVARTCCMEGCDNAAQVGSWCEACWRLYTSLESLWERQEKWEGRERRGIHLARIRRARRWQFFHVFLIMSAFEGLMAYALDVPWTWQFGVLCLGWALGLATLAAMFGGGRGRSGRR